MTDKYSVPAISRKSSMAIIKLFPRWYTLVAPICSIRRGCSPRSQPAWVCSNGRQPTGTYVAVIKEEHAGLLMARPWYVTQLNTTCVLYLRQTSIAIVELSSKMVHSSGTHLQLRRRYPPGASQLKDVPMEDSLQVHLGGRHQEGCGFTHGKAMVCYPAMM